MEVTQGIRYVVFYVFVVLFFFCYFLLYIYCYFLLYICFLFFFSFFSKKEEKQRATKNTFSLTSEVTVFINYISNYIYNIGNTGEEPSDHGSQSKSHVALIPPRSYVGALPERPSEGMLHGIFALCNILSIYYK